MDKEPKNQPEKIGNHPKIKNKYTCPKCKKEYVTIDELFPGGKSGVLSCNCIFRMVDLKKQT